MLVALFLFEEEWFEQQKKKGFLSGSFIIFVLSDNLWATEIFKVES